MEGKPKKFAILLILIGPILIFLGSCLLWFFFAGTGQYYWGTAEVSGWVSLIGTGTLDRTSARVTMWSSPTYWSTDGSDFWYGYLSVVGLIAVSASVLVFLKADRSKTSMLLTLIGCSMVVSAWLMAIVYYKPHIFVIKGQIDAIPGVDVARLYAAQATVNNGLGPWLSLIGSILSMITTYFFVHLKIRKKE